MNWLDWLIVALVVAMVIGGLFLNRFRKSGCCSSGDCGSCCCNCHGRKNPADKDGKDE